MSNWDETFEYLNEKKMVHLFGGVFAVLITSAMTIIFNLTIPPLVITLSLALFYSLISSFQPSKELVLINEAFCYVYASTILMILGIFIA